MNAGTPARVARPPSKRFGAHAARTSVPRQLRASGGGQTAATDDPRAGGTRPGLAGPLPVKHFGEPSPVQGPGFQVTGVPCEG